MEQNFLKVIFIFGLLTFLVTLNVILANESCVASWSSLSFNKSVKFASASFYAYHMELDLYRNNGSILFSDLSKLRITDGQTTSTLDHLSRVTGFKQINRTHVAIVRHYEHCIQVFNQINNSIQTLAGTCGVRGFAGGEVGIGKLYYPYSVEKDVRNPNKLLVTDEGNNALRSIDISTRKLETVISTGFKDPKGLIWKENKLLVANDGFISQVSWFNNGSATVTKLAGSTSTGNAGGTFQDSKFHHLYELADVGSNFFLVAEHSSKTLRLIDFNEQVVGPVCFNGENPCTVSSKLPSKPRSLLRIGDDLYVGMDDDIYKFSGINRPKWCPFENVTAYLTPGKSTGEVRLSGQSAISVPEGVYKCKNAYNTRFCPYYVTVKKSSIVRRLMLLSIYDAKCSALKNATQITFFESMLLAKRSQFNRIFENDRAISFEVKPTYSCDGDELTVYWPTDTFLFEETKEIPAKLKEKINARLHRCDLAHLLEIFVLNHDPLFIPARSNDAGEVVHMTLKP